MFSALYHRVLAWSAHQHAPRYLFGLSFAESSFFPIPPDVMLLPMCFATPRRAWYFALLTTVASVLGGIAGYAIGYFVFDSIEPWLRDSSYWDAYLNGREWFDKWGVWAVLIAGFSPIPYKIFTITAGVAMLNLPMFVLASFIGRGSRFFLLALLVRLGGPKLYDVLPRYIERIGWASVAVVVLVAVWFFVRH